MGRTSIWTFILLGITSIALATSPARGEKISWMVVYPQNASVQEQLAAREVQRYVYLRTGQLLSIVPTDRLPDQASSLIVIGNSEQPLIKAAADNDLPKKDPISLNKDSYRIKTIRQKDRRIVLVTGKDSISTLYGAYRFAEHLGVRFYLEGDVIPDQQTDLNQFNIDETRKPLFELRGIQPFHDFPEGPDWWNEDDYKAVISQLPKMGMNFIGLHTYPESTVGPEPTVWIGQKEDFDENGRVRFSYPASYANTQRQMWGYQPTKTSQFAAGASLLFDGDDYGPEVLNGQYPKPETPEACNDVFNQTTDMLAAAFKQARVLGVKTCVGTEAPLFLPQRVYERLRAQGKDPLNPEVKKEIYEAIFQRIAKAYPIDYYWLWTSEGIPWTSGQTKAIKDDLRIAQQALENVKSPFKLATCGWSLGPPNDPAAFDKVLPKDSPLSCINSIIGHEPVEPTFGMINRRPIWAIPWLENDFSMICPQLWVGRMRYDAIDARDLGCTGLIGIHWRTKVIGPNVSALAQAAWSQPWASSAVSSTQKLGAEGGNPQLTFNKILKTNEEPIYRTFFVNLKAYHLKIPNGIYSVTLKFCESSFDKPGKRIFGIRLQGLTVLDQLDICSKVGKDVPLDCTFKEIRVMDERLDIEFTKIINAPLICGIVIEGMTTDANQSPAKPYTKRINCGGGEWTPYEADITSQRISDLKYRTTSTTDFWTDWAKAQFGSEPAQAIAKIFETLDGPQMPAPGIWLEGPGAIPLINSTWEQNSKYYQFVDDLAALRPTVKGNGNLARFDYWLNTFRYLRAFNQVGCAAGKLNPVLRRLAGEPNADVARQIARQEAIPAQIELANAWNHLMSCLLAATCTSGEMGTIANLEMHWRNSDLNPAHKYESVLLKAYGMPLPAEANPTTVYSGPSRIIMPTIRSSMKPGESLTLKVIILDPNPSRPVLLYWRPLGSGKFSEIPLVHTARGIHKAKLPTPNADVTAVEYYVMTTNSNGQPLYFPATAPQLNQTVVMMPMETQK